MTFTKQLTYRREARERELLSAYGQLGDANEVLNERAVAVMKRMSDKLTGRDFLQVRDLHARPLNYIEALGGLWITRACLHSSSLICLPRGQLCPSHLPAQAMSISNADYGAGRLWALCKPAPADTQADSRKQVGYATR